MLSVASWNLAPLNLPFPHLQHGWPVHVTRSGGAGRADRGSGSLVATTCPMVCIAAGVQLSLNTKKQSLVLSFTAATRS